MIIAVYVDDFNLLGTLGTCSRAVSLLTAQFEMKLLGKTIICLGFQEVYLSDGSVFLHRTTYTQNLLKRIHMDHASPLSAPMMGRCRTLDDPYCPCEEEEEEFYDKSMYLPTVGVLMYLSTYTRPDMYCRSMVPSSTNSNIRQTLAHTKWYRTNAYTNFVCISLYLNYVRESRLL